MTAKVDAIVDGDLIAAMRDWRRDFHRHPELAFKETRTAEKVAALLTSFGLEVHSGIAGTGVVGILDRGSGPSIGMRADMDALPIAEETALPYASAAPGCMHACGHDGHTAMLLGAAKILARRQDLTGRFVFIFQPAEENEGGARAMIEDGLFRRFPIDTVFGLHNMPGVPVGTFLARPGIVSAAFDTFSITVQGQGGHGAMPETTRDPIVAASALVLALNTVVSRNIKPQETAVLTIGQIIGGDAFNVIPERVLLKGSCRSMTEEVREVLKRRIEEICQGIGATHGVKVLCDYEQRYPAVSNSERETAALVSALRDITGDDQVITEFPPFMGSEDFSFFLQEKPGCYFVIGSGDTRGQLHSSTYDFNDDALKFGVAAWVAIATTVKKAVGP